MESLISTHTHRYSSELIFDEWWNKKKKQKRNNLNGIAQTALPK